MKTIKTLAVVIIAGLALYIGRVSLYTISSQTYTVLFPCRSAITYRIGSINPQFHLSTSTALADMKEAARLWNEESGTDLLFYDPTHGMVVINFEYDVRQETTQELATLGTAVNKDRASYDALKTKYDAAYADYSRKKAAFVAANAAFQKEVDAYQSEVNSWNARGGAPKHVYDQLEAQKAHLAQEQSRLEQSQSQINAQVEVVNTLVLELNALARSLNLDVSKYNTIGSNIDGEFEQGVYESALGSRTITIFEYENHTKLVRVLAHEMGHAIGLDHASDKSAIMAELNQGAKIALTVGDAEELDRVCRQNPFSIIKTKLSDYLSSFAGGNQDL